MVSLSIPGYDSSTPRIESLQPKSLQNSAFWYPAAPGMHLCLNDHLFSGLDTAVSRFQPLCWKMFGGPRGSFLGKLTGMTVYIIGGTIIEGLVFEYEIQDDFNFSDAYCLKIGPCHWLEPAEANTFAIDGSGGERVVRFELGIRHHSVEHLPWYYKHGVLESVEASELEPDSTLSFAKQKNQVQTNWGRQSHFSKPPEPSTEATWTSIVIEPEQFITGLYWCEVSHISRVFISVFIS